MSIQSWAVRVAEWRFSPHYHVYPGYPDGWLFARCMQFVPAAPSLTLSRRQWETIAFRLPGWLGEFAFADGIAPAERLELTEMADQLFDFIVGTQPGAEVRNFWREFMEANDRAAVKPEKIADDPGKWAQYQQLLGIYRRLLQSKDEMVVETALLGIDWIWGEEKKAILRAFLATRPSESHARMAEAAMDSNLW